MQTCIYTKGVEVLLITLAMANLASAQGLAVPRQ